MQQPDEKPLRHKDQEPQPGVVDFNHLRKLLFNDTDYIKEMLHEFLAVMPANMQEMRAAAARQQWGQVAFLAHRLKSSLGIVPITHAMEMTKHLEEKAEDAAEARLIPGKVENLAALLEQACNEIRAEMQREH
ncbi:Hpt domain-containing protein [uncultured Chitinophaga sp.]|jgi:FOG: HPt domain|uniref:Hpt domain-containing protein n=1 Tax=uncultured Chitinophaga sp. TaxID=339340 RepID=UPI002620AF11|nr:Hpt domain-containing protein [uncultured Chitinophaga sp.]